MATAGTSKLASTSKASNPKVIVPPSFVKPEYKPDGKLPIRLVLCFDGTGDTVKGSFSAVNGQTVGTKDSIGTIWDLTKGGPVKDANGKEFFQYAEYFEGVGTVGVSPDAGLLTRASALFDGATGHGYLDILRHGYKVCCQQLQDQGKEHEIFIFGFSRGAFISRALASFLQYVGILKAEFLEKDEVFEKKFRELLGQYSKLTSTSILPVKLPAIGRWGKKAEPAAEPAGGLLPFCIPSPRVRMIGAFDTVKTVIPLPFHNYLASGQPSLDFKLDAPGIVDHFRHALALNEARPLFNPDLWNTDANSAQSSYLEAWFFGYHHDIGGGDAVQGLALWPLQWVLNAAAEYGLILDPEVEPYDVLFKGGDNIIETPHDIALKMFDMIKHHTATKLWGLRLNEPFSLMSPQPRQYFQYLTTPPYLKLVRPKVFLHPSAYLVFDVSSSFRIQVYQWKHFRKFLQDRAGTLPLTANPWWEKQAVGSILRETGSVERLNVVVLGRPGTGKAAMVGRIFGQPSDKLEKHGIGKAVEFPENKLVSIRYSTGFGEDGNDDKASMQKFFEDQANNHDINTRAHVLWYFLDCNQKSFTDAEKEFFKMKFEGLPILVVLQNEDKLKDTIRESAAGFTEEDSAAEGQILSQFNMTVKKLKDQLTDLPVQKYVHARSSAETPKNLLNETASTIEDEAIHIAQVRAQRIEVKPKIALATEESVRAYTIWYLFKSKDERNSFHRNKDPEGMLLSDKLLEPVLNTFNMGFDGDSAFIKSRIGEPWKELDNHKSGLCDKTVQGYLILMCMLDTIVIMTYALAHRQGRGYTGLLKATPEQRAKPLTQVELEQACAWFTNPKDHRQEAMHKVIKELLDEDGSPKSNDSITNLQMKIIETMESFSGGAESASGVIGGAMKWVTGWRG